MKVSPLPYIDKIRRYSLFEKVIEYRERISTRRDHAVMV